MELRHGLRAQSFETEEQILQKAKLLCEDGRQDDGRRVTHAIGTMRIAEGLRPCCFCSGRTSHARDFIVMIDSCSCRWDRTEGTARPGSIDCHILAYVLHGTQNRLSCRLRLEVEEPCRRRAITRCDRV